MIKFIHCADIHLGSRMEARLPRDKSEERKREVRATFGKMVQYAADNGVKAILMSGDVFDSDRPLKKDKEYFYSVIKSCPQIDFLYLRGNHDGDESYTEELANLKTFTGEWKGYDYGNVHICGAELDRANFRSLSSTLRLDGDRLNIVMLHGQADSSDGVGKINLQSLREKNIDYLALGHIHSFRSGRLDGRGQYAYSGCLEGRGFDETGEKGFVLIEAEDKITFRFVPFASRTIWEQSVDLSGINDWTQAVLAAKKAARVSGRDMLRLNLVGEVGFDNSSLSADVQKELAPLCYFASVKDNTVQKIDVSFLAEDKSIKGEFIRAVRADNKLTPEQQSRIISAGLKALAGRGEEL